MSSNILVHFRHFERSFQFWSQRWTRNAATSDPGTDARSDRPYLYFSQSSQKATKSWHWPGNQCSSVSVQHVNVHIVDAVNSIVWQKLLRVLNLRKTSIIYTVSSLDKTSDISKLEQFHISDIYLDCKGAKVLHITAWMQIRCAQSQSCICSISLSYTLKLIWKPCLCHGLI